MVGDVGESDTVSRDEGENPFHGAFFGRGPGVPFSFSSGPARAGRPAAAALEASSSRSLERRRRQPCLSLSRACSPAVDSLGTHSHRRPLDTGAGWLPRAVPDPRLVQLATGQLANWSRRPEGCWVRETRRSPQAHSNRSESAEASDTAAPRTLVYHYHTPALVGGPTETAPMSTNGRQSSSWQSSGYIHQFGFELAKEVIGVESVERCARDAFVFLQRNSTVHHLHHSASWRHESCRYPWSLAGDGNGSDGSLQALFVDISFDFTFFPVSFTAGNRAPSCHVINLKGIFGPEEDGRSNVSVESESVAVAVAVRFGALGKSDGGFTYWKGTRPFAASDLDEHCRSIDLILEEMTECNTIAKLMSEGIKSTSRWLISCSSTTAELPCNSKEEDEEDKETTKETTNTTLTIKVHYDQLEAQGHIPLSADENEGEPVGHELLMTLLQTQPKCSFVSVPTEVAKLTLMKTNPGLIAVLSNPPEKVLRIPSLEEAKKTRVQDLAIETDERTSESSKKVVAKKSSSRQETAVYATKVKRGKKKAKFTWS